MLRFNIKSLVADECNAFLPSSFCLGTESNGRLSYNVLCRVDGEKNSLGGHGDRIPNELHLHYHIRPFPFHVRSSPSFELEADEGWTESIWRWHIMTWELWFLEVHSMVKIDRVTTSYENAFFGVGMLLTVGLAQHTNSPPLPWICPEQRQGCLCESYREEECSRMR